MLKKQELKVRPNHCIVCDSTKRIWLACGTDYEYGTTDIKFNFYQCLDCFLIYIDPIPDESTIDTIYPANYYSYQTHNYNKFIKFMRGRQLDGKVKKFLNKSKKINNTNDLKVLDIGCGSGDLLMAFRRFNPNISLAGADFSEGAIKRVKALGFKGYSGDICKIDFGTDKFDLIICQQLIEHLHDPLAFLEHIKAYLKSDGVLILETPGVESVDRNIFKGCWGGYHIPRHLFLFSERTIRLALSKHGFKIVDIFYDFCLAFWVWSLHNLIVKYTNKRKIAALFSLNNPLALLPFWIIEHFRMPFMKTASMGIVCRKDN